MSDDEVVASDVPLEVLVRCDISSSLLYKTQN